MAEDCILSPEETGKQRVYTEYLREWNKSFESTSGRARRVFVLTFGCQQNESDSEKLLGMALDMGYQKTDVPDNADLIIVNTCAIREHAEQKTFSIVGGYKHLKDKNPELIIGMCGCMVTQDHRKADVKQKFHQVDFILGTSSIHRLPEVLAGRIQTQKRVFCPEEQEYLVAEGLPVSRESSYRAYVSIMYGCNNFCSYCIVPYVRGRERSRRMEDIVEEVKGLVSDGYRDIMLLGQNVNSYARGRDYTFSDLLREIDKIPGEYTLRFMSSHPKDMSRDVIDAVAESTHIEKHIHLPMQSGSDRILKVMNRHYDMDKYLSIIDYIRRKIPDAVITSDIIVGFPGETEEDFEDTLNALRQVKFDMLYPFIYSPRKGTPAAVMEQVPDSVKSERFTRMLEIQNGISLENNLKDVGKTVRVLCDGKSKTSDLFSARTDGNKIVFFEGDGSMTGKFLNIKLESAEPYAFRGKIVE